MVGRTAGPDRAAIVETVASALRRCDKRGLLRSARSAMLERKDVVPLVVQLRIPTVFVTGAEDALFPVEEARSQASAIPDCQFVVVEHSSHQSALEAPGQVLAIVRERLAIWEAGEAIDRSSGQDRAISQRTPPRSPRDGSAGTDALHPRSR